MRLVLNQIRYLLSSWINSSNVASYQFLVLKNWFLIIPKKLSHIELSREQPFFNIDLLYPYSFITEIHDSSP